MTKQVFEDSPEPAIAMDEEMDPSHQAAAEWLVRLQDRNVSLEDTLEWQQWMTADACHAAAFERMEAVWEEPWEILQPKASIGNSGSRRAVYRWAIAASVAAVAIASGWLLNHAASNDLQTRVGETHSTRLSDGSMVTLGGDTRLKISFDDKARRIELTHGEALFKVAKDPARPFAVRAGNATVTAVGTEFNVRKNGDRAVVSVTEGRVVVVPTALPTSSRQAVRLDAGQQTIVDRHGEKSTENLSDAGAATAWQSGRLVFRREPLRYVIEDVNRYSPKPIVLDDSTIGDIRITGTVLSGSVDGWVESLENAFALQAMEESERIVISRKR